DQVHQLQTALEAKLAEMDHLTAEQQGMVSGKLHNQLSVFNQREISKTAIPMIPAIPKPEAIPPACP
ncbi:MAG: hypothetical protein AAGH79_00815, partial [Bacteroidota bacterium]